MNIQINIEVEIDNILSFADTGEKNTQNNNKIVKRAGTTNI